MSVARELKALCEAFVETTFPVLTPDDIPTVDEWLDDAPYPLYRKKELAEIFVDEENNGLGSDVSCKSFVKVETYPSYKYPRAINSRSDSFKVYTGPYFKAIEKALFAHPAFIKHVPAHQRAAYIKGMLNTEGLFYITDYTSFEGIFIPKLLDCLEFVLYRHMLRNFPAVLNDICHALGGVNKCRYRGFCIKTLGTRMSGDMCTSLGNGFSNMMLMNYVCAKNGIDHIGIYEGDDGILKANKPIEQRMFRGLGVDIKLVQVARPDLGAFCGLVCAEDGTGITDPRKMLLNFGWSHSPYARHPHLSLELLRAKAMSVVYEYPRCPIVTAIGMMGLRLTGGVTPRFGMGWWERQQLREMEAKFDSVLAMEKLGCTPAARELMQELFGIDIEWQLEIEARLQTYTEGPLHLPHEDYIFQGARDCADYHANYVRYMDEPPMERVGATTFDAELRKAGVGEP